MRDNYDLADGRRIIIATDRLSAFDRIITAIPFKGQVLTQIARFWFDATDDLCPNHVLDYPDPNVLVCRRLTSCRSRSSCATIWRARPHLDLADVPGWSPEMYGIGFPDGLRDNQTLPTTIITPTTKAADGGHDEPLTADEIIARGLLAPEQWHGVETGSRPVRPWARHWPRARPDPGRHQV